MYNVYTTFGVLTLCYLCVIRTSNSFHSFIFKFCILIVHTLKMCTGDASPDQSLVLLFFFIQMRVYLQAPFVLFYPKTVYLQTPCVFRYPNDSVFADPLCLFHPNDSVSAAHYFYPNDSVFARPLSFF